MIKKLITIFFYKNNNHYINAMTGHTPNTEQNQEFLSTMHTMIDDLDTISSAIDENIYIRLVNGLLRLYNIHNSSNQSPSSVREPMNQRNQNRLRENLLDNNEVEITRILARHYGRVYDSSGVLINNDITTINSDANTNTNASTISDANVMIRNDNVIIDNNNNNNNNDYDSLNQALFRENARIGYATLYSNAFDYWNQARYQNISTTTMTITSR
jgi:hypothetical protein